MAVFQGPSFAGEQITMTLDEMIRLAQEAGWQYADSDRGFAPLWAFGALVAAAEREACAQVCDEFESDADPDAGAVLAAAIRARGNNA